MKVIKVSLIVVGFCFLSDSYAMENDENSIREVFKMRDSLIRVATIVEIRDRTLEMPIFKSAEAIEAYNLQETREALHLIIQVYNSWVLVARDLNARPEYKQVANSLLDDAIMIRIRIDSNLD